MAWVKAFHIVFVVAWFAGVFYLPRIFVNHAQLGPDETAVHDRLALMERKLFRFTTMNMVLALGFGTWLLFGAGWATDFSAHGWLHAKLALVAVLVGYHGACGRLVSTFAARANVRSHRFYRLFNEVPVLLLVAVVVLVVVKPF
jgi:protoporphyrinogen IX oxidase